MADEVDLLVRGTLVDVTTGTLRDTPVANVCTTVWVDNSFHNRYSTVTSLKIGVGNCRHVPQNRGTDGVQLHLDRSFVRDFADLRVDWPTGRNRWCGLSEGSQDESGTSPLMPST